MATPPSDAVNPIALETRPSVLRKDQLRVSRSGGGYRPQFVGAERRPLAATILKTFERAVGTPRGELDREIEAIEREADDFKLVRGLAALCERDLVVETDAAIPPERVRRTVFESAETIGGVTSDEERTRAIDRAAAALAVDSDTVETALYADREENQIVIDFEPRWDAAGLLEQYNLSLAQTALFDATEIEVRSDDPKALVSAVKRLRLLYEIELRDGDRVLIVTGPDALFRRTRRYGTAFARLLRSIAGAAVEWELTATIDDRGRERTLRLNQDDVSVPDVEPIAEPTYDSGVEADFAARFSALDLDWEILREPAPLRTGHRVMIPDFAFEYDHADFRVYFEIMGFWTPEYVEKKLEQIENVEDVEFVVAVDESLGVGETLEATGSTVISYSESVRIKDVVDVLSAYERDLVDEVARSVPDRLTPEADVVGLDALADEYGVPVEAISDREFPAHRLVGRTLIRPAVLDRLGDRIEEGMAYDRAKAELSSVGICDPSATLSALGYRVEWDGLSGGTIGRKTE